MIGPALDVIRTLLAATEFELADETQRERRPRKGNS